MRSSGARAIATPRFGDNVAMAKNNDAESNATNHSVRVKITNGPKPLRKPTLKYTIDERIVGHRISNGRSKMILDKK